jgi:hypothetical protein
MHRKSKFVPVVIVKTITVSRCRIGTVMQRLYYGLHSRNARKFGKHRRGTLVLHGFDGQQDTETGMWTVVLEFRRFKGCVMRFNDYGVPEIVEQPSTYRKSDFRKLFR